MDHFAVCNFIQFELLGMSEMLEDLSVIVSFCNFLNPTPYYFPNFFRVITTILYYKKIKMSRNGQSDENFAAILYKSTIDLVCIGCYTKVTVKNPMKRGSAYETI